MAGVLTEIKFFKYRLNSEIKWLHHSEQSKHKINICCDFTVASYPAATVYLQTHGSVKHHISPICSSVMLFFNIPKLFWLTLYSQRHWKLAFHFISKNVPVITSMCANW